jgi:hypothetical protein
MKLVSSLLTVVLGLSLQPQLLLADEAPNHEEIELVEKKPPVKKFKVLENEDSVDRKYKDVRMGFKRRAKYLNLKDPD